MMDGGSDTPGSVNTGEDSGIVRVAGAPGVVSRRPRFACLNPLSIKAQGLPQQRAGRWFSYRNRTVMPIDGAPVATSSPQMRQEVR
jgi:hypothetical protein